MGTLPTTIFPRNIQKITHGDTSGEKLVFGFTGKVEDTEQVELNNAREEAERERREKQDYLASLRMPIFCPSCNKPMNKRLDRKFWTLRNKCLNCVTDEETQMRIDGTWDTFEKSHVEANAKAYFAEKHEQLNALYELLKKTEFVKSDGTIEKWESEVNPDEFLAKGLEDLNKAEKEFFDVLEGKTIQTEQPTDEQTESK